MRSNGGVFLLEEQGVLVVIRGVHAFFLDQSTRKCFHVSLGAICNAHQSSQTITQVTCGVAFKPHATDDDQLALLVLADERKLIYFQLQMATQTLQLVGSVDVPRNATCMAVTAVASTRPWVVIGEKTGEVIVLDLNQLTNAEQQQRKPLVHTLLGHTTSMITDLCFNHDKSLLLTADRDEKVRVSSFPHTSVIAGYCLGHHASVSQVTCSRRHPDLAVSIAMDQTIKLWQLPTGQCLDSKSLSGAHEELNGTDLKAYAKASMVWSQTSELLLVLVPHQPVQCFEIVLTDDEAAAPSSFALLARKLDATTQQVINQPLAALFLHPTKANKAQRLALAYANAPYFQVVEVDATTATKTMVLLPLAPDAAIQKLVAWSATSSVAAMQQEQEQEHAEHTTDQPVDDALDGMQKKKLKTK